MRKMRRFAALGAAAVLAAGALTGCGGSGGRSADGLRRLWRF